MGEKILIATGNKGKLREFARMLALLGYEAVPPQEAGVESLDVLEDGTTFAENAYKKARAYSKASGLPALAAQQRVYAGQQFPGVKGFGQIIISSGI